MYSGAGKIRIVERERNRYSILGRLGKGVSASKAAKDLFIERTTVDTHLCRIRDKLGLRDILDVIIWATL